MVTLQAFQTLLLVVVDITSSLIDDSRTQLFYVRVESSRRYATCESRELLGRHSAGDVTGYFLQAIDKATDVAPFWRGRATWGEIESIVSVGTPPAPQRETRKTRPRTERGRKLKGEAEKKSVKEESKEEEDVAERKKKKGVTGRRPLNYHKLLERCSNGRASIDDDTSRRRKTEESELERTAVQSVTVADNFIFYD
ncbi:hypothetical protein ElyMa_000294500 [Elysia marginata]|uniref:Uncharacterized protein n=1 Tax=Elysia marginata TaxID=1093978 RepID=A0AAV4F9U2_9GAST|nr:hypothetical protein ElyMa_000294500 [Elysia marginata]